MDPLELPVDFPSNSLRILLGFVRGKETWSREVLAAAVTVVAYASQMAIPPKVVGSSTSAIGTPADPGPTEVKVAEALQMALDQHEAPQVKTGIIPWALLVDWALQSILKKVFTA